MVFAGNFENCGESVCKGVYLIPYSFRDLAVASKSVLVLSHNSDFSSLGGLGILHRTTPCSHTLSIVWRVRGEVQTYMLVDQDYANVFSLFCKHCECLFYMRGFGLMVDDEKVPLRIGRLGNVADTGKQEPCDRTSVE
jgi:hypothetical protein